MDKLNIQKLVWNEHDTGLGLVTRILEKHDHAFVYAGARDPDHVSSLRNLQIKYPERIALVKCVSADVKGNTTLAREIEKRHGRLDTVIANAGTSLVPFLARDKTYLTMKIQGICDAAGDASNISVAQLEEHFHARLYSFSFDAITLISIVFLGECHWYHCPVSSSIQPSQEKHLAALCPDRQ